MKGLLGTQAKKAKNGNAVFKSQRVTSVQNPLPPKKKKSKGMLFRTNAE